MGHASLGCSFFLVPPRAPAGSPQTSARWGGVFLSVEESHLVQGWGYV